MARRPIGSGPAELIVDLFECPGCGRRFIATIGGSGSPDSPWSCSTCGGRLELQVRSIPGPAEPLAETLDAEVLDRPPEGADHPNPCGSGSAP